MKKLVILALLALAWTTGSVLAESQQELYRSILISDQDFVGDEPIADAAADAKAEAKKLLSTNPRSLRKQKFPELRRPASQAVLPVPQAAKNAPFGLIWGATIAETKNQGIALSPIGEKDYVNNFRATSLPKPVSDFSSVDVTFGQEDRLWRIIAYGKKLEDDAKASKILRLYQIYNQMLTKKYGHAQEFFTPAEITRNEKDKNGRNITITEKAPLGNPQFLSQLQAGTAELYSTYYNEEVGAALAVNVDGSGQSYIVVDYKNLNILKQQENKTLDAL